MAASGPGAWTCAGNWGADLAAEWGYADQAHLIREFRAMAGVTPADYVRDAAGQLPDRGDGSGHEGGVTNLQYRRPATG